MLGALYYLGSIEDWDFTCAGCRHPLTKACMQYGESVEIHDQELIDAGIIPMQSGCTTTRGHSCINTRLMGWKFIKSFPYLHYQKSAIAQTLNSCL